MQAVDFTTKNNYQLYSFDIFDTLITRKTATPKGIFLLVQELIKSNDNFCEYFRSNFYTIRCETESFVRENQARIFGHQDITFDEIYERIQVNHYLSDEQINFLKNLEIECEIQNLIPIDTNINKLKFLVNSGKKVVLISDMYHSSKTIKMILNKIDPIFSEIEIFVSSDVRKTKSKGDLFKYVKEKYNPQTWIHTGDNINADYNVAKHNKLDAELFNYPKLKEYEISALKKADLTSEYYIGTAKNLRIHSKSKKYDFGASFAGPILFCYVNWIIENSLRNGIENLYFISRDGYIPKLIAERIINYKKLPIRVHYIYGSRKAWRVASKTTFEDFINNIFKEYFEKFSGEFFAERLGITKEELKKYTNLEYNKKVLKSRQRKTLYTKLINDKEFKEFLIEKHSDRVNLIIKYLEQEIDFSKKNFAFVDLNGTGRTQDILANLISLKYNISIQTFYFCSDKNLTHVQNSTKRIFMCSNKYKHFWLELLCRTPYGQTTGYKENNSKIEPITENIDPNQLLKWGFEDYVKGIIDFSTDAMKFNNLNDINFYYKYFTHIMQNIDKETADILGSIPFSGVGEEKEIFQCAPAYNIIEFLYAKDNGLLFISKGRTKGLVKQLINIKIKYKSLRRFIISLSIHKKKNEAFLCILGLKIDIKNLLLKGK